MDYCGHGVAVELLRQRGAVGTISASMGLVAFASKIERSEALKEAFVLAELRERWKDISVAGFGAHVPTIVSLFQIQKSYQ